MEGLATSGGDINPPDVVIPSTWEGTKGRGRERAERRDNASKTGAMTRRPERVTVSWKTLAAGRTTMRGEGQPRACVEDAHAQGGHRAVKGVFSGVRGRRAHPEPFLAGPSASGAHHESKLIGTRGQ